ncbi:DUF3883 domain-containing protein [Profundibacter amoris]|uniref:DUF3883 domain-containing protein n=1 Tax=Profundibacter amoris TaxID=2171755 RepID=A0A347UG37_9RHOB|nr:DUF3883 domain-containing protein [Profundibacter amoris]AXX97815.1 DUF3883 domain-containing protein [Profundibacter amoris]
MTEEVSTERLFSFPCFEGLRLLRQHSAENSGMSPSDVLDLVVAVEADAASLDLEAALFLGGLVEQDCPLEGEYFYQICIKAVVIRHQPIWAKSMKQGRIRFINSLGVNDQGIFAAAGLLDDPPTMEVVSWWDDVVGHARLAIDIQKMEQARIAEALSIEYEQIHLNKIGITKHPKWVGLDDNFAGYDVLSYDLENGSEVNRMIEVKSTINSPLRFFVSRNEWKTADTIGDAYSFHVWNMAIDPPQLHIRSVEDIRPHIPSDNAKGAWSNAAIPIGI